MEQERSNQINRQADDKENQSNAKYGFFYPKTNTFYQV